MFVRWPAKGKEGWALGRFIGWIACGMFFLTGLTGVGLMSSVPQTALMLLIMGWFVAAPQLKRDAEQFAPFVPKPRRDRIPVVVQRSIEPSGQ
jgi:hypothetical protein